MFSHDYPSSNSYMFQGREMMFIFARKSNIHVVIVNDDGD